MTDKYVAPFCTPEECDHDGPGKCSQCCPCEECGQIRAEEEGK